MKIFKSLLFASLLHSVLSCREKDSSSDNRYDEVKELSDISRLKVNGVFNLYLTQSDEESIQISGSPELVEKLKIEQNGDLLELTLDDVKGSFFQKVNLEVNLALADLKEFEFNGVGNIQTKNNFNLEKTSIKGEGVGNLQLEMSAHQIIAELNFLGNMEFKGNATSLVIVNEDIGNVDASALTAEKEFVQFRNRKSSRALHGRTRYGSSRNRRNRLHQKPNGH